jgi:hypothetical protein
VTLWDFKHVAMTRRMGVDVRGNLWKDGRMRMALGRDQAQKNIHGLQCIFDL